MCTSIASLLGPSRLWKVIITLGIKPIKRRRMWVVVAEAFMAEALISTPMVMAVTSMSMSFKVIMSSKSGSPWSGTVPRSKVLIIGELDIVFIVVIDIIEEGRHIAMAACVSA